MPPSAPASAKARDAMLRETRALIVETVKFDGMAWFRFDFAALNVDEARGRRTLAVVEGREV
jgi:hypothetical protein